MPNNEIFSDLPGLGDLAGLENYLNNQTIQNMGVNQQQPSALVPNPSTQPAPAQTNVETQPQTQPEPQPQQQAQPQVSFTNEQIAQIIEENNRLKQAVSNVQNQPTPQPQTQPTYTAQQAVLIKQLIDRGVPLDKIAESLRGGNGNNELVRRIDSLEQHIRQQAYLAEQNAFIEKMTAFGNKFGLSEDDLVTFANKAYANGINVAQVSDVEAIFRTFYPEQYAIRSQRLSNNNQSSQIFGGTSIPEAPRSSASRAEDAYVEAFLKGAMPNQYNMNKH